jgi:hypothetical protein
MESKLASTRRTFLATAASAIAGLASGCGMLLHPERRGQPPGGGLDWSIVALDGLGMLLFFIPGIIAFAVDFATGAIYLPPPGYGHNGQPEQGESLLEVHVPRERLSQQELERIASEHTGREVRLVRGEFLTAPLARLADFWPTREKLVAEHS